MVSNRSDAVPVFTPPPPEPLYFLHIPKTAGSSMRLYLDGQYASVDRCPANDWLGLAALDHPPGDYRLVRGHFGYNLLGLLPDEFRTLTILRDPVQRVLSALRHAQRDPNFSPKYFALAKAMTLQEMVRQPELMANQSDVQVRLLCHSRDPEELLARLRASPNSPLDPYKGERAPSLELAISRLESFDFVGLTEDLPSLLAEMSADMSFHASPEFPHLNRASGDASPPELTAEDIEIVRSNNPLDERLYAHARELVARRKLERTEKPGRPARRLLEGPFELSLAEAAPGAGWYKYEQNAAGGWRWTGPDRQFTLELPLRPGNSYRLCMDFHAPGGFDPSAFSVALNGTPAAPDLEQRGKASFRCHVAIAGDALASANGACQLSFDSGRAVPAGPNDQRVVGVAVSSIFVETLGSGTAPGVEAAGGDSETRTDRRPFAPVPEGSFEIPLDGVIPGAGWYKVERNAAGAWRWTGPSPNFTLELMLQASGSYLFEMVFAGPEGFEPGRFSVDVNGIPAERRLHPLRDQYRCQVRIPSDLLARSDGACRLRFDTGRVVHFGPDERLFGVSVRRIRFERLT